MGYRSSRGSTETSPSIWRRLKPIRAAWWSFVMRCEDMVASHEEPPPNNSLQSPPTSGSGRVQTLGEGREFDLDFSQSPDYLAHNEDKIDTFTLLLF